MPPSSNRHADLGAKGENNEQIPRIDGRDIRADSSAKGFLIVDVYERETGRLVWCGSVENALASDPDKADKKTEKAVTKLLEKFPPPKD